MYKIIFARNLRELRKSKDLRQIDLASIMSVSKTTICQWETCKQEPSIEDITKLATYFNVSTDYLLGLEDEDGHKEPTDYNFEYQHADTKLVHREKK